MTVTALLNKPQMRKRALLKVHYLSQKFSVPVPFLSQLHLVHIITPQFCGCYLYLCTQTDATKQKFTETAFNNCVYTS